MKVNYPETIIRKSAGVNSSEAYLSRLCDETFLALWSYPNIYRDQGRSQTANGLKRGDGKELCDLLAIFDNNIFIFSDKDCAFPNHGDIMVNWGRWYKRTIQNAADQIFGAERWLFKYPESIYLDKKCENAFPIPIPTNGEAIVHRIVIAHGASPICRKYFHGGSGSLVLNNTIVGRQHYDNSDFNVLPFQLGHICPDKGFVHVFDDVTLGIVMQSLDTVSDFTEYLQKKEALFAGPKAIIAAGEEELLACYLTNSDGMGNKDFEYFNELQDCNSIILDQGCWRDFCLSQKRQRQIEVDRPSYFWDAIIEKSLFHIITGTSGYMSDPTIKSQEQIFRFLAREKRLHRRILGSAFLDFIEEMGDNMEGTRAIPPLSPTSPAYLFFLFPYKKDVGTYEEYREVRRTLLSNHVIVLKKQFPHLTDIIGIATEAKGQGPSEDIVHLDANDWASEEYEDATEIEKKMIEEGLLNKRNINLLQTQEFPKQSVQINPIMMAGKDRNKPCPCGSGKKYKKCCGHNG